MTHCFFQKLALKGWKSIDPPPPLCGFSKNVFSRKRVGALFFVAFNIIISHIFPENFTEITQVVQNIDFLLQY